MIDALAEMLMTVGDERTLDRSQIERVELDLSIGRVLEDGRELSL